MSINIENIMKVWPLSLGEIVAGKNGTNRIVKSVSVLEVPQETKWFKGGELQISAFYTISDNSNAQIEVLNNLNKSNCSGLILCHFGHWLKSISPQFIEAANNLNFPVITVPENIAYIDIITPVMDIILEKKNIEHEFALDITNKMTSLLLDNNNIDNIIYSLSKNIKKPVLFFDISNKCVTTAHNKLANKFIDEIAQFVNDNTNNFINEDYKIVVSNITKIPIILFPTIINKKYYGTIAILSSNKLNEFDIITINASKYALGIAVKKSLGMDELEKKIKKDFFIDIISNNYENIDDILDRANTINIDLFNISRIISIKIENHNSFEENKGNTIYYEKLKEIFKFINARFSNSIIFTMIHQNNIVLFLNKIIDKNNDTKIKKLVMNVTELVKYEFDIPITIGISNYCNSINNISIGYDESIEALKYNNIFINKVNYTFYNEINLFSLLFNNVNSNEAYSIIDNLFKPITDYDNLYNTDLKLTLKTLIYMDYNTLSVANKMFLHRNTVQQRKNKISELLNFNIDEYPYKQILELAIILEKTI